MKKVTVLLVAMVVFLVGGTAMAFPSLPDDLNIVQPDLALPKELADFSGKWMGSMFVGRTIDLFLIIEKIDKKEAQLYLYGTSGQWERATGEVVKEYGKYKIYFKGNRGYNQLSLRGKYLDLSISSFTAIFTRVF